MIEVVAMNARKEGTTMFDMDMAARDVRRAVEQFPKRPGPWQGWQVQGWSPAHNGVTVYLLPWDRQHQHPMEAVSLTWSIIDDLKTPRGMAAWVVTLFLAGAFMWMALLLTGKGTGVGGMTVGVLYMLFGYIGLEMINDGDVYGGVPIVVVNVMVCLLLGAAVLGVLGW